MVVGALLCYVLVKLEHGKIGSSGSFLRSMQYMADVLSLVASRSHFHYLRCHNRASSLDFFQKLIDTLACLSYEAVKPK